MSDKKRTKEKKQRKKINKAFTNTITNAAGAFKAGSKIATNIADKAVEMGKQTLSEQAPKIAKASTDTMAKAGQLTENMGKAIYDGATVVKEKSNELTNAIKDKAPDVATSIKDSTSKAVSIAGDAAKKTADVVSEKAVETKEFIQQKAPTQEEIMQALDMCYAQAIDGVPGVSETVEDLVDDYISRYPTEEKAAKSLINYQIAKCTTSGFLTGLGGIIAMPLTIPANIATVWYVQLRMIAALAKIGGFDPRTDQVQTLVYACLTGQAVGDIIKRSGIEFGKKLTTSSINKISGATLTKINQAVGFRFVTKFGEKGIINLGKAVPVVGGIIGGGFDFVSTRVIANNAYRMFINDEETDDVVDIETENLIEQQETA